jgi:hypothetical protein
MDQARVNDTSLDLGPMDLRHAVDNLQACYSIAAQKHIFIGHWHPTCHCKNVGAVRVNCLGDKELFKRATFESVTESVHYMAGESEILTPVAEKIGLPLVVRKIAPAVGFHTAPAKMVNKQVGMLNPPLPANDTGSILVARRDGKPLLPIRVHALIVYTAEQLKEGGYTEDNYLDVGDVKLDRLQHVSKADFEKW